MRLTSLKTSLQPLSYHRCARNTPVSYSMLCDCSRRLSFRTNFRLTTFKIKQNLPNITLAFRSTNYRRLFLVTDHDKSLSYRTFLFKYVDIVECL